MCACTDIPKQFRQYLFIFHESRHHDLSYERRLLGWIGNSQRYDHSEWRDLMHAVATFDYRHAMHTERAGNQRTMALPSRGGSQWLRTILSAELKVDAIRSWGGVLISTGSGNCDAFLLSHGLRCGYLASAVIVSSAIVE